MNLEMGSNLSKYIEFKNILSTFVWLSFVLESNLWDYGLLLLDNAIVVSFFYPSVIMYK